MTKLEDIPAYQISSELGDRVWKVVVHWDILAKKTIGEQLIAAVDSIAANIAEGFGRHFKRDKIKFFYYSRGSLIETAHWIKKARGRGLLGEHEADLILNELRKLPKLLNYLIKITRENLTE